MPPTSTGPAPAPSREPAQAQPSAKPTAAARAAARRREHRRRAAAARLKAAAEREAAAAGRPAARPSSLARVGSLLPSAKEADESNSRVLLLAGGVLLALVLASGSLLSVATRTMRGQIR